MIEQRRLGRTGLSVSALGFGCGAVGGLMTRGTAAEQERAIAGAVQAGVTYFDTAASYGDGESERNLGRALRALKLDVTLGTKVGLASAERGRIGPAIAAALEASLARLGRDSVDLFQLHNPITAAGSDPALDAPTVLGEAVPALARLREQGKTRFIGITGIGDPAAIAAVVESGAIDSVQIPYNLLNPSAAGHLPAGLPGVDYAGLMPRAQQHGVGVIGIRVLAAGALSGAAARHPNAMQTVAPIASDTSYDADLARARLFRPLVEEGLAGSLVEAAIRFALSSPAMSTVLIGIATPEQFETAAQAAAKGPLPQPALDRLAAIYAAI